MSNLAVCKKIISKIFDTEVNQCMSDHVIDTSQNLKNFPLFQSYFKDFWSEHKCETFIVLEGLF